MTTDPNDTRPPHAPDVGFISRGSVFALCSCGALQIVDPAPSRRARPWLRKLGWSRPPTNLTDPDDGWLCPACTTRTDTIPLAAIVTVDRHVELLKARLVEVEAERDALCSQVAEASHMLASALYGEERAGEQAHLPTLARMMVDALTLETVASEQARMQLDSGDDVDAATRRYLGEALGIAPPDDTPPSLSDFYDAVVEARDERDALRLRIAEVGEVLTSDADEAALRQAVARLVYEARDMGGEK